MQDPQGEHIEYASPYTREAAVLRDIQDIYELPVVQALSRLDDASSTSGADVIGPLGVVLKRTVSRLNEATNESTNSNHSQDQKMNANIDQVGPDFVQHEIYTQSEAIGGIDHQDDDSSDEIPDLLYCTTQSDTECSSISSSPAISQHEQLHLSPFLPATFPEEAAATSPLDLSVDQSSARDECTTTDMACDVSPLTPLSPTSLFSRQASLDGDAPVPILYDVQGIPQDYELSYAHDSNCAEEQGIGSGKRKAVSTDGLDELLNVPSASVCVSPEPCIDASHSVKPRTRRRTVVRDPSIPLRRSQRLANKALREKVQRSRQVGC